MSNAGATEVTDSTAEYSCEVAKYISHQQIRQMYGVGVDCHSHSNVNTL